MPLLDLQELAVVVEEDHTQELPMEVHLVDQEL
jgi:hypothetical protein